ncbi:12661_t:CDS:2 [Funneliformis caledonium]|uniref:12661_t:CDS:1 n=1 Tax=Funneliformis caledonium TaxID=1117310 RepID=A0A9N8YP48_9GLOM|nr:12661_t:CDS:2 [Funneliformis caledonium]
MNQIVNQIKSKFNLNNQTEEETLIQSNEKSKGEKVNDKQNDFGFNCKCEGDWCECDTNQFFKESKAIGCYKKLNELSKDEKERFKLYGICSDCKQMNTEESETAKEFLNADEIDPQESTETAYHPQAIYTSRFLSFANLPKPINSTGVQIEDSEVPDSQIMDVLISI